MKFNCNRIKNYYRERQIFQSQPHDWFAWRPVKVSNSECRWLEVVIRTKRWWNGQRDGTSYSAKEISK